MQTPGEVSTWIFLRGLTRSAGHWGRFSADFQAWLPNARIVMLDTAGNGARYAEQSPWSVADMVQDCRSQLLALGVHTPVNLFAMSLGGMVAAQWAIQYPSEISRLVLVGTSMRPLSPFYRRLRPANYLPLLKLVLGNATAVRWEQEILRRTSNHPQDAVLVRWIAMRLRNPVSASNALRQLLAAARYRLPATESSRVKAMAAKTLLLAGEKDGLVSARCTAALAKHWQCASELHPTAGHDLPLDDGPWVAKQVRQWLLTDTAQPALQTR